MSYVDKDTSPSYLTPEEAGLFLRLSIETLRRWRWSGKGPAYTKFGRAVRYSRAALLEFASSSQHGKQEHAHD